MEIILTRKKFFEDATLGIMKIYAEDGTMLDVCHTLEPHAIDWKKEKKVMGRTAIPEGRYRIEMQWSRKYHRLMPFLQNVPQFTGVMIHPGNTSSDTEGCILVGESLYTPMSRPHLQNSRPTFERIAPLFPPKGGMTGKSAEAGTTEDVWITVGR
ncbi:MAG: hypothetical protein KBT20_09610 [Bacteroidales bacterium]|nr:hypothetical protein [Candidatus Liminaster caballi]